MPSREPPLSTRGSRGRQLNLFNQLLDRAEANPCPDPLPDPDPRHFLPRSSGDAHLQVAFEHALIYEGLTVTASFNIPVRPPPRPKGKKGKRSRPRATAPLAQRPPRQGLRSDADLPPGRVPREPDRNARILAEDALQIDRKSAPRSPPVSTPPLPPPILVSDDSDSSEPEYVNGDDEAADNRSDLELTKDMRARAGSLARNDPPTPTTPSRGAKMDRLRRGAASICASPARSEPSVYVPPAEPEPKPAARVEKERSPKTTRVSKTVSSPVKRLSDKQHRARKGEQRTEKDRDEIVEVDIVPVRVKHPTAAKQAANTKRNSVANMRAAKPPAKKRNGPDEEGSWLSDTPLGTGFMPKAGDVIDEVSPVMAPTSAPKTTKRGARSSDPEKNAEVDATKKPNSSSAKASPTAESPLSCAKRKPTSVLQTPRKRKCDAAVIQEPVSVNVPKRKAPRTAEKTSSKSNPVVIHNLASPELSERKPARIAEEPSTRKDLFNPNPSVKPSPKKPQKSLHPNVKLRSPKEKSDSRHERCKPPAKGISRGPPERTTNVEPAKCPSGNRTEASRYDSTSSTSSPLRDKLAASTRPAPKANRALFSRASESQVSARQERLLFSPLTKNLRQRKERNSGSADCRLNSTPAIKSGFPIKRLSDLRGAARRQHDDRVKLPDGKKSVSGRNPPLCSTRRRESPRSGLANDGRQRKLSSTGKKEPQLNEARGKVGGSPMHSTGVKRSYSDIASLDSQLISPKKASKRGKSSMSREPESGSVAEKVPEVNVRFKKSAKTAKSALFSPQHPSEKRKKDVITSPRRRLSDVVALTTLKNQRHGSSPDKGRKTSSQIRIRVREPAASGLLVIGPEVDARPVQSKSGSLKLQDSTVIDLVGKQSSSDDEILKDISLVHLGKKKGKGKASSSPARSTLSLLRKNEGKKEGYRSSQVQKTRERIKTLPRVDLAICDDDFLDIPLQQKAIEVKDTSLEISRPRRQAGNSNGKRSPAKRARLSPKGMSTGKVSASTEEIADTEDVIQVEVTMLKPKSVVPVGTSRTQDIVKTATSSSFHAGLRDKRISEVTDEDEENPSVSTHRLR